MALVVLCGASFYVYKTNDASETYENKNIKNDSNMLSMMLETSAGSGEYKKTSASAWPMEGYVFNENLSRCEQGSSLSWDSTKNTVIMKGNITDKCYVYFDKNFTLTEYVISQYTGIQGKNNLYYHDSTLTNGAGDNSYRYAGSSETTNNFVCFGYDSTDGTCPTDYLYRIIGVFDNQVKLIKYDYATKTLLGTDEGFSNMYSGSGGTSKYKGNNLGNIGFYDKHYGSATGDFMKTNLNNNYISNMTNFMDYVYSYKWNFQLNSSLYGYNAYDAFIKETTTVTNTFDNFVGLMYVSDYGYAAAPSAWTTTVNNYNNSSITSVNWMYMGLFEWMMPISQMGYGIGSDGQVYDIQIGTSYFYAVRPCIYLKNDVGYASGTGTANEPIRLS